MAFTTEIKSYINKSLQYVNLHLDTLTAERQERNRLKALRRRGQFTGPVFPVPSSFTSAPYETLLKEVASHRTRFDDFQDVSRNDVGYTFDNDYFTSPDAEVLYALVRRHRPERVVEVGSGNSTRISRQAILDGELDTELISIDPQPRTAITDLVDTVYRQRVETVEDDALFAHLKKDDILFIDSSHEIKTGNDVAFLYLHVLPKLASGVLVHIHDVFLPYDYPKEWVVDQRWGWNEQYLVQAMLTFGDAFDVLWPGHYLHRNITKFEKHFPHIGDRMARSLWLQKI